MRVIVHAGFHKTGTTSLQDFFSTNAEALAPYLAYYGKADFLQAGAQARIYAQRPFPHRLYMFRRSLRRFLESIPEHETIVLSRETFSGGMPGHHTVSGRLMLSYERPAQRLARVIISELHRRFGRDAQIVFFYTTREREPWLRSVYGHLLRSIRVTDDWAAFKEKLSATPGPEAEAKALAHTLPVPVQIAALEEHGSRPEGPAAALLDMLGVSDAIRANLVPVLPKNTADNATLQAAFLRLNREIESKAELKARKEALL